MLLHEKAQWIWIPEEPADDGRNLTARFRRVLELESVPAECRLAICADSRFTLFVNGERVGYGPARSWPHKKMVDEYELSAFLRPGRNVLAVQVVHWGIACSFDIGGTPGGLIASLEDGAGRLLCVTDGNWQCALDDCYRRNVPRQAYGMAYSEQVDARPDLESWRELDFDCEGWMAAREWGPQGTEPWVEMEPRSIPLLLEQRKYPRNVLDPRVVRAPECSLFLDLAPLAWEIDENLTFIYEVAGIVLIELRAEADGEIELHRMCTSFGLDAFREFRVNGKDVTSEVQDKTRFQVREGSNLLAMRFYPHYQSYPAWVFRGDVGFTLHAPLAGEGSPAAAYGCRSLEGDATADALWAASSLADLEPVKDKLRAFRPEEVLVDPFTLCHAREVLRDAPDCLRDASAMLSDNAAAAGVSLPEGGDVEFLLDFGEELVGYLEFEIDAAGGTILDLNGFEGERGGVWVWTDNLNNTLRYTAREGWQRYTSVVRRGFRYLQVTVREATRPLRIRSIRCVQNTYPVQELGAFRCSDAELTRFWEIARRTTQLCMEDTFVDCPAYEQTFWVGDCRNESLANFMVFGDTALVKRCLVLAADSLFRSPIPEQCVPYRDAHKHMLPAWALFWVLACEELYQYEADLDFAREIAPSVEKTLGGFLERRGEDGLMRFPGWNMLDWAEMDCPTGAAILHENAWLTRSLRAGSALVERLGNAEQAGQWRQDAEALTEAINREFWDPGREAYADSKHEDGERSKVFSQQSQTVAFLCNCVPEERREAVLPLLQNPTEDMVGVRTPFMAWFCFEAFAELGDHKGILDWMRDIWGTMLRADSTTCWEHFCGFGDNAYRWAPTRSWCHAWSAAPAYFLPTYQLGVQPLAPGWERARIAPEPVDLTWAAGRVPTPRGIISVDWEIRDGVFDLRVQVPQGIELEYEIPVGLKKGSVIISKRNAVFLAE